MRAMSPSLLSRSKRLAMKMMMETCRAYLPNKISVNNMNNLRFFVVWKPETRILQSTFFTNKATKVSGDPYPLIYFNKPTKKPLHPAPFS